MTIGARTVRLAAGLAAAAGMLLVALPSHAAEHLRWLVGFRAGADLASARASLEAAGLVEIELVEPRLRLFRAAADAESGSGIASLMARRSDVAFAEPDVQALTALVPNDPEYATQWHLPRLGLPEAWAISQGSERAPIAIVDSGIDPFHPDLKDKLRPGINTADKHGSEDQFGHGTKMAGIAAASTDNGLGIAGVAPRSPLIPVRVTDRQGRATGASISKGIVWAVDHGARVINLSLDGVVRSAAIRSAAQYAHEHGALVVVPSGNCSCRLDMPDTPYVLSVAGTDERDQVLYLSTTGAFVDLAAPGAQVPTTAKFGLYQGESGTSVSSAIVSGVASLMFAVNPDLTPDDVRTLLLQTAVDPQGAIARKEAGRGRIDALAAVKAAAAFVREAATPADRRDVAASGGS